MKKIGDTIKLIILVAVLLILGWSAIPGGANADSVTCEGNGHSCHTIDQNGHGSHFELLKY